MLATAGCQPCQVTLEPFERGYGHTLGNALAASCAVVFHGRPYYRSRVTITGVPAWVLFN
jgi:hypothetical protein